MSPLQVSFSEWFAEYTFIVAVILAIVYIPFYDWRESLTGKAAVILILSFIGALFRDVLIIWKVIPAKQVSGFWDDFCTWVSIICVGTAGLALTFLILEALRIIHSDTDKKWLSRLLLLGRKFER